VIEGGDIEFGGVGRGDLGSAGRGGDMRGAVVLTAALTSLTGVGSGPLEATVGLATCPPIILETTDA
jgi:hypothetical protein